MAIDLTTLALAKNYTNETVAAGMDPAEVRNYIDGKIQELIGGASSDADTLKELEDAIAALEGKVSSISVSKSGSVATLIVTDSSGKETTVKIYDGAKGDTGATGPKGDTPVKGVDYWTEEDIDGLMAEISDKILNGEW